MPVPVTLTQISTVKWDDRCTEPVFLNFGGKMVHTGDWKKESSPSKGITSFKELKKPDGPKN